MENLKATQRFKVQKVEPKQPQVLFGKDLKRQKYDEMVAFNEAWDLAESIDQTEQES